MLSLIAPSQQPATHTDYIHRGADVNVPRKAPDQNNPRQGILFTSVPNNLHITHAFYTHPKILVAALNGPCVGLSAAIVAHADFVYAAPHAFLLTPFSSLGLVSEGLAAQTFVERLGRNKANEALIQSKRITSEELVHTGFVNKIIDAGNPKDAGYSDKFLSEVLKEVDNRMGNHLSHSSMLAIKKQIKAPYEQVYHAQGAKEVFGLMDRFLVSGLVNQIWNFIILIYRRLEFRKRSSERSLVVKRSINCREPIM